MARPPHTRPFNFENSEDKTPTGPTSYQHAQPSSGGMSTQLPVLTSQPPGKDNTTRHIPFPRQEPLPGQQIEERISNDAVSAHNRPHGYELQDTEEPKKRTVDTHPRPKKRPYADVSPPSAHRALQVPVPVPPPSISTQRSKTSQHFNPASGLDDSHLHIDPRASTANVLRQPQQQASPSVAVNGEHIGGDGNQFLISHEKGVAIDGEYQSEGRGGQSKNQSSPTSTTMSHKGGQSHTDRPHHQGIHTDDYTLPGNTETEDIVNMESTSRAAHTRSFDRPDTRQPKSTSPFSSESIHHGYPSHSSRLDSRKSHELHKTNIAGSGKPPSRGAEKVHSSSSRTQRVSPIRRRAATPAARLQRHHTTGEPRAVHKQSPRPPLEGSNVSRRRAAVSTTARSEIIDITSTPGSEIIRLSPTTNNKSIEISQEFTKDLAGVLNRFTTQHNSTRQELKEKYHNYIKQLKKKIKDREHEAKGYLAQIEEQASDIRELDHSNGKMANKIDELEHSKGEMTRKITEMEAVLEATIERGSKAEDKYRKVKDHLNAAIEEQQKLYLMSKSQWEKTIKEVRETERRHGAALEETLQKAEVIRHQMLEKVRQTVGQCRQDTAELYGQIDNLTRQIEQKDAELNHKKEAVRMLSQQLETLKITNGGFEALESQQKDILGKMEEQNAQAIQTQARNEDAFGTRLDQIAEQVGSVSKAVSEQPQALLAGCVAEKEETLKTCQVELKDLQKRFENQQVQFSQLQAHAVELEVSHEDNQPLNQQLQLAQAEIERLEAEVRSRTAAISQLEKTIQSKEEAYVSEVKQFGSQVQQLNQLILDKEAAIESASSKSVDLVRRELLAEKERETAELNKKISQLRSERDTLHQAATQLRQERARREEAESQQARMIESLKANLAIAENKSSSLAEELKTRSDDLAESRHQRSTRISALGADLAVWQKKAAELEANYTGLQETERQHTSAIESLKVTLASAESKCSSLSEELKAKSLELEKSNQRRSSRITDLEKELASWQEKAAQLQATYSKVQKIDEERKGKLRECLTAIEQLAVKEGIVDPDADTVKLFDDRITLDEVWPKISNVVEQLMKVASTKYQTILDKQRQQLEAYEEITSQAGLSTNEDSQASLVNACDNLSTNEDSQASLINACNNLGMNPPQETQGGNPDGIADMGSTPPDMEETSPPFLQHRVVMGLQDQGRRVAVRRPTSTEGIRKVPLPPPPSVAQEKSRRREAVPPKSIMKRVTRSVSREQLIENSSGSGAFGRIGPLDTFTATPPDSTGVSLEQNHMSHEVTSSHFSSVSTSGRPNKRKRSDDIVDSPVIARRGRYSKGAGGKSTTKTVASTPTSASGPNTSDEGGPRGIGLPQRIYRSRHAVDRLSEGFDSSVNGSTSINSKPSSSLPAEVVNGANRFLPPRSAPTRTYGSRKSVGPAEGNGSASQTNHESQTRSQSQLLSRYSGANDETQDSMTLSQIVSKEGGDDLLLPPPDNKS
ncbi:hypothetical protein B0T09DRAFT_400227 [Sordaria sp. MPI-SDFR-AT-0083]|nr:hypothetical protein B0T09DRAFT_400227 [Sordaria sp. MPI-SDFR-AT-0083]